MPGRSRREVIEGAVGGRAGEVAADVEHEISNSWAGELLGLGEARGPTGEGAVRGDDISRFTPAYVHEHRAKLGMSEGIPDVDFFNEFVAHEMTGEDDERRSDHVAEMHELERRDPSTLTDAEKASMTRFRQECEMMRAWGYDPEVTADHEVVDPETGLYVVRFDPLDPDNDLGSITSFRGTHTGPDFVADGVGEVGSLQYDPNREAISSLIAGGTGPATFTGHSLGGYLAERAAVDHTDVLGNVVTFQAGGLTEEHAAEFERNRGDISVRHHSCGDDLVHLAGERRLDGETFHHHVSESDILFEGHTGMMMAGTDERHMASLGVDEGVEHNWDPTARHFYEAGRRGIGAAYEAGALLVEGGSTLYEDGTDLWAGAGERALGGASELLLDGLMGNAHLMEAEGASLSALMSGDLDGAAAAAWAGGTGLVDDVASAGGHVMDRVAEGRSWHRREGMAALDRVTEVATRHGGRFVDDVGGLVEHGAEFAGDVGEGALNMATTAGEVLLDTGARTAEGVWDAGVAVEQAGERAGGFVADTAGEVWDAGAGIVDGGMRAAGDLWNALW